jgi:hypothetical protein
VGNSINIGLNIKDSIPISSRWGFFVDHRFKYSICIRNCRW